MKSPLLFAESRWAILLARSDLGGQPGITSELSLNVTGFAGRTPCLEAGFRHCSRAVWNSLGEVPHCSEAGLDGPQARDRSRPWHSEGVRLANPLGPGPPLAVATSSTGLGPYAVSEPTFGKHDHFGCLLQVDCAGVLVGVYMFLCQVTTLRSPLGGPD